MAYMSTTSGGFVGMGALIIVALAVMAFQAATLKPSALIGVLLVGAVACLALGLSLWSPEVFGKPFAMIDGLVFHKTASASYIERSMWNQVSYQAFLGTFGLGAGMGGARASSWIFAVLGNIGFPGALLMAGFMLQVLLARPRGGDARDVWLAAAAKLALIPNLVIACLSGTAVGFGLGNAWLLALAAALAWPLKAPMPRRASPAPEPRRDYGVIVHGSGRTAGDIASPG
jgi:hypothetical protein